MPHQMHNNIFNKMKLILRREEKRQALKHTEELWLKVHKNRRGSALVNRTNGKCSNG